MVDFALLAEEFVAVDRSVPLTLFATLLGLTPVLVAGNPDEQKRYLEPFLGTTGAPVAAFAFTEPGGSADYDSPDPGTGVRTVARLGGPEWVISGAKQWVSSATGWNRTGADVMCVVCRTDPQAPPKESLAVIVVPKPEQGLTVTGSFDSMGHRAHLTPKFRLDGVRVPKENILGCVGEQVIRRPSPRPLDVWWPREKRRSARLTGYERTPNSERRGPKGNRSKITETPDKPRRRPHGRLACVPDSGGGT